MDSQIFELQIVFYFQLFLSANVRHSEIPFGNSNRENGPTFLDFPLFLGIFQWEEPTKRVPFTAEPEIRKF